MSWSANHTYMPCPPSQPPNPSIDIFGNIPVFIKYFLVKSENCLRLSRKWAPFLGARGDGRPPHSDSYLYGKLLLDRRADNFAGTNCNNSPKQDDHLQCLHTRFDVMPLRDTILWGIGLIPTRPAPPFIWPSRSLYQAMWNLFKKETEATHDLKPAIP